MLKSSPEQIRARFDKDVERFSNLDTGQSSTIDAPLVMDLITRAAVATNPNASEMLDIGCGAGNYSVKMLQRLPGLALTLVDLSRPMLDRALERVTPAKATAIQGDIRAIELDQQRYDIAVATAVMHHLREEDEWRSVFRKVYHSLKPGGSFWIADLVEHSIPVVQRLMWERYGDYLTALKDESYRDHVFSYVAEEDSPRPLLFQIDCLREAGFSQVDVLHKNGCFAAFGAVKQTKDGR